MKKISYFALLALMVPSFAHAAYSDKQFTREVARGLDIVTVRETIDDTPPAPMGELGADVYDRVLESDGTRVFIPTSMYMRAGAGLNLSFATDAARVGDEKHDAHAGWTTQIGLGWNLSSYVRTELDFQQSSFEFADLPDATATYRTAGAMLYFDFARRYVHSGDVTYRRRFVPFMGLGAAAGQYRFEGAGGADGFVIAAPRATFGFNVMLTELLGIDVMYQYQMMIGNGFGWNAPRGGVDNISNVIASFRMNF